MSHLYLLVEGQTEETFVRETLEPYYARQGLYCYPIIVSTSAGQKGGVVSYAKVKPQIERLCRQHASAYVSTMFDLYALPKDFPGKAEPGYPIQGSGAQKAEYLEKRWQADIAARNFIPNLIVHEFEALLFAGPESFAEWLDESGVIEKIHAISQKYSSPEDINESRQTAPSKRVQALMPTYQKTFHGPLIAGGIGLDALRASCPHFNGWLQKLEALLT